MHRWVFLSVWMIAVSGSALAQTSASSGSSLDDMRDGFAEVTALIVKAAEMVPDAQYGYRPAAPVRTFGQLIGHVADGNNYYCRRAAGASPEWAETVATSGAGKAELIAKLKESIALCVGEHKASNSARSKELLSNFAHVNLHYGNLVTYLRTMGLTPPSS